MSGEELTDVLSTAATMTALELGAEMLYEVRGFADQEIAVIFGFPPELRLRLLARLVEVSEIIRDVLEELDGRIMQLRIGTEVSAE